MKKVYLLIEENESTGYKRVEGVYATKKLAQKVMKFLMDFNPDGHSYHIKAAAGA